MRQVVGAMPLHGDDRPFLVGLERDERGDRDPHFAVPGHDARPVDAGVAIKGRLDFPQLDAIAAFLDHPVAAAVELEAAAADILDEIAGPVPASAVVVEKKAAAVSSGWPK